MFCIIKLIPAVQQYKQRGKCRELPSNGCCEILFVIFLGHTMLWILLASGVAVFVGLYILAQRSKGVCRSTADLSGKTVIITGANAGELNTLWSPCVRNASARWLYYNLSVSRNKYYLLSCEKKQEVSLSFCLDVRWFCWTKIFKIREAA